jgi:hypothetical protein
MQKRGASAEGSIDRAAVSAHAALLAALKGECGPALRDVHVMDEHTHESVFLRSDVRERLADVSLERYIDNERLGYLSHDTYEGLHYAEFRYTVRGFDEFTQFRTFLGDGEGRIGVLASVDAAASPDFDALFEAVSGVVADTGTAALGP